MQNGGEKEEEKEDETDYMDYIKPAAAALIGVLGGLLLAKGVKKLCDNDKKQNKWLYIRSYFFFVVFFSLPGNKKIFNKRQGKSNGIQ